VAKVIERVRAKDIKIHLDTTAVELLIDRGYDPTYGARPMRRAVEKYLEDPLAEVWLVGFGGTLLAVFPRLMASAWLGSPGAGQVQFD
jgi:hypothetical protein